MREQPLMELQDGVRLNLGGFTMEMQTGVIEPIAIEQPVTTNQLMHEITILRGEVQQLTRMVEILPYTLYQERYWYRFVQWIKRIFRIDN